MAETDRAIVVGVSLYPFLGDLSGPENDATAFTEWLIDPNGGAVPEGNVKRIVSSDFGAIANPRAAKPTTAQLVEAFDELVELGETNAGKVGRRLYVYLAGHGFAPTLEDTALLMANAARGRAHHLSGRGYVNWFRQAAYFEEVVLLMDCCREKSAHAASQPVTYDKINGEPEAHHLYGFATEWSRASREVLVNGKVRGLFTVAVIEGLKGSAPRDAAGHVTAEKLADYVHNYLPKLTERHEVDRQDPTFDVYRAGPFVLVSPPPVLVRLRAKTPPGDARVLDLQDGTFKVIPLAATSPGVWEWDVAPATYQLRADGVAVKVLELFEALGTFDVNL